VAKTLVMISLIAMAISQQAVMILAGLMALVAMKQLVAYKFTVAQSAKLRMPDSKWTTFQSCKPTNQPSPWTPLKRTRWPLKLREALVLLTALLEDIEEEDFSLKETIPMP